MLQINYELQNVDLEKSMEKIKRARELLNYLKVVTHPAQPDQVWFRQFHETTFTLYHTGKMQVNWNNLKEKEILFEWFKSFLVPTSGHKVNVKPESQTKKILFDDEEVKTEWCEITHTYVLKRSTSTYRRERWPIDPKREKRFLDQWNRSGGILQDRWVLSLLGVIAFLILAVVLGSILL